MVGDYKRDINFQFTSPLPLKQIHQAVIEMGHKDAHPWSLTRKVKLERNGENFGDGGKRGCDLLSGYLKPLKVEDRSHQKIAGFPIGVMIGVQDISAKIMNEPGNPGDNPFLVFTVNEENGRYSGVHLKPFEDEAKTFHFSA